MQYVMTRVFPLPAPARMSTGPSVVSTASRCCGLSWERKDNDGNGSRVADCILQETILLFSGACCRRLQVRHLRLPCSDLTQIVCRRSHHASVQDVRIAQPRSGAKIQPRAQALGSHGLKWNPEKAQETLPQARGNNVASPIFSTKGRQTMNKPEIPCELFAYPGRIIREIRRNA